VLASVNLGDRLEQFVLVFDTEREAFVGPPRKHRDASPFRQRCSLKHDLPTDDGSSDDLHLEMVPPSQLMRIPRRRVSAKGLHRGPVVHRDSGIPSRRHPQAPLR